MADRMHLIKLLESEGHLYMISLYSVVNAFCQEPCCSLTLSAFLYKEDQGSNPSFPIVLPIKLSKKKCLCLFGDFCRLWLRSAHLVQVPADWFVLHNVELRM